MIVEARRMRSPTLQQVVEAICSMTPRGGPGFVIVEAPNREFAQTAGGDGRFTVEWGEFYGEGTCQWKAGLLNQPSTEEAIVHTNGYVVRVRSNEVLGLSDAITILTTFLSTGERPRQYAWRIMPAAEYLD